MKVFAKFTDSLCSNAIYLCGFNEVGELKISMEACDAINLIPNPCNIATLKVRCKCIKDLLGDDMYATFFTIRTCVKLGENYVKSFTSDGGFENITLQLTPHIEEAAKFEEESAIYVKDILGGSIEYIEHPIDIDSFC